MISEQWKPISGWEGLYEVSDEGRVRSLDRIVQYKTGMIRKVKGRNLKPRERKSGHLQVCLRQSSRVETPSVHVLVATAFLGSRPDGCECLHYDGNPENNRVGNLSWGTRSENRRDMIRHGTHPQASRTHCPRGHVLEAPNVRPRVFKEEGRRQCLACARARSRVHYHKDESSQFEALADSYYSQIMSGFQANKKAEL